MPDVEENPRSPVICPLDDLDRILGRPNARHRLRLKSDPNTDVGRLAREESEFLGNITHRPVD